MSNLPRTMQAAILTELKQPLTVAEIELPKQLNVGQVLVKVHYSGICGSQIGEINGVKGEDRYLPHLLGHEGSGTVLAVGAGVSHVQPGNKVVLHWRKGAGIEAKPPVYMWNDRQVNAGWITTFNEYAIVSENRVTTIPDDSDMKTAALFGCAITTGFGVVENNAQVKIGESVVVYGAGGIGLNIIQAASMRSAFPIIAVDLHNNRLQLAKEMGATHLINSQQDEPKTAIRNIIAQGVDIFIDNTGKPAIIEMGYTLTHQQGKVVLVGVPKEGDNISLFSLPLHFGKCITGSFGGESQPHLDILRYMKTLKRKNDALHNLLTDDFSLSEVNTALERLRHGEVAGRCILQCQA